MSKNKRPASTGLMSSLASLGGAAALMSKGGSPSPAASSASAPATSFPIASIHADPDQPRRLFKDESLQELAASIRELGVIQAIVVQPHPALPNQWIIVAGERRWRASKLAGLQQIPAVITTLSRQEVIAAQLIENIQREDLSALEVARSFGKLQKEFNLSQAEVAKSVGKSKQLVSDFLAVLEMPSEFQELLEIGKIRGATDLTALWRLNSRHPERVAELIQGASQEAPITRAVIRSVSAKEKAPADTQSPAGRTPGEGAGGELLQKSPPADGDAGGAGGGSSTAGAESGGTGAPSSTPDGQPRKEPTTKTPAAASKEVVYTLSTAQKNGEWLATIRLGSERIFLSEPCESSKLATAQAAGWLIDHAEAPE